MPSGGNRLTAASATREELRPVVAITLGDPAGVGPEVTLKALADPEIQRSARFIVLGDRATVTPAERSTGIRLDTLPVEFRDCRALPADSVIAMGTLRAEYGLAAVRYVTTPRRCACAAKPTPWSLHRSIRKPSPSAACSSPGTPSTSPTSAMPPTPACFSPDSASASCTSPPTSSARGLQPLDRAHHSHHRTRRRSHEAPRQAAPAHRRLRPQSTRRRARPLRHRGQPSSSPPSKPVAHAASPAKAPSLQTPSSSAPPTARTISSSPCITTRATSP